MVAARYTLEGGAIIGAAPGAANALVNSDNTISGYGLINNLVLTNDFIIDANAAAEKLTLATGQTIDNADLIEATGGGVLDIQDSTITWTGVTSTAGSDGILLAGTSSTLLVDVGALTLDGGGAVQLQGGTITGNALNAGDMLVNLDNTISGYGTISNLTLINDFIIDAENGTLAVDGVIVTNNDAIDVGITTTATLLLDGGTSVAGGTLTIGASGFTGTVDVEDASNPAASLDGVTVNDYARADGIEVGTTTTATLLVDDGTTIDNGTLTIGAIGASTFMSTVDVEQGSAGPGATLNNVVVDDDGIGSGVNSGIYVGSGVLTLEGNTQIQGGPVADAGTMTIASAGQVTVDGVISTVGTWQNTTPLSTGESGATSVVANGYVYEIGGINNPTGVEFAALNADGTLGAWQTAANSLPTGESGATSVVANGYVYEIGGNNNSTLVQYALLNADGTPGAWQTTSTLPTGESGATSVVANGYVYEIGGNNSTGVEFAALNADGTLGAWQTAANSLPTGRIWGHVGCRQRLRL